MRFPKRYLQSCLTQYSNPVKLLILLLFFVAALIRDYGDDGFKVAVKGGDYLIKAINNLDDDVAELFVKTASKQGDSFYDYLKSLDES